MTELAEEQSMDVLCCGILVADVLAKPVKKIPLRGRLDLLDNMEMHGGGCANNTAIGLARLGISAGVAGKVGSDGFGDFLIDHLRRELLSIYGIGQETADSIILYAANKSVFVIDAYTRRIISRLGMAPPRDSYDTYQAFFMSGLPSENRLFNEYHALLVCLAKNVCRPEPLCQQCCLNDICKSGGSLVS